MTVYSFFNQLYSLDTLDTRFTTSSKTPSKDASEESVKKVTRDVHNSSEVPVGASPSRWYTAEFYLYALVFVVCVPQMYKAVWDVSQTSSPHYKEYENLLSPGWLFGRKVDNSDGQYAGFRDNIPYLAILLVTHPLLRRGYESLFVSRSQQQNGFAKGTAHSLAADVRLETRLRFDLVSSLVLISALHGFSALKVLLILFANYTIAMQVPQKLMPSVTWSFNIAVMFANELAQGYRFSSFMAAAAPFYAGAAEAGKFLDSYGGLVPRWEVLFNITILRLISFNMDYYWSLTQGRSGSPAEVSPCNCDIWMAEHRRADDFKKKQLDLANLSERDRVSVSAPAWTYLSFRTYLAYVLYPPLYLAGPILTFNDYISQSTYRSPSITTRRTTLYAIRFLLTLFCMEFLLHTAYTVAIIKSDPDWSSYAPFQLSMLAYFNLQIVWLKLLIPWRLFRLWSLIDGIDPPENVIRCMSDNYSTVGFWRAWHRSYNRWLIRYLYVPLGGMGRGTGKVRGIVNMLAVFTFVALWHDINLQLLMWGWLVVFFVLPEVLATLAFPQSRWKDNPTAYRYLCGVGAVVNILMMMAANLVGFVVGIDGLKGMIGAIMSSWQGAAFMFVACATLFVGAQVMFEHREEELRKGIKMKC